MSVRYDDNSVWPPPGRAARKAPACSVDINIMTMHITVQHLGFNVIIVLEMATD
jgi:hypothetical protein